VRRIMQAFRETGAWEFGDFERGGFSSSRCDDAEIPEIIRRVHRQYGYVADPHTACAFKALAPDRVSVVLATASPAKFPDTIRAAIGVEPTHPSLEALKAREIVKHLLPATPAAIRAFVDRHALG
jgi:threonine synthase